MKKIMLRISLTFVVLLAAGLFFNGITAHGVRATAAEDAARAAGEAATGAGEATAGVTGSTNTNVLTTTITLRVSKEVMSLAGDNALSIRVYLPCISGQVLTPGTAKCPQSNNMSYTLTKKSTEDNGTALYTKNIVRSSADGSVPATGWIAEAKATNTSNGSTNTYLNRVNIVSIANNPTIVMDKSTGGGSLGGYRLFPDLTCSDDTNALNCWLNRVWGFTQVAVLVLSIAAFVVAGVIYMTSSGNPKQIEMAKKIMLGALSAIAVVVLGKFFLTKVVGIQLQ